MASNYPNFAWREATPGVWHRDVDEIEEFYAVLMKQYEGSGRMFFAITGYASLSIEVPEGTTLEISERQIDEALQKAWITLRYDHPTLASRVIPEPGSQKRWTKKYYQFEDKTAENIWIEETFVPISTAQTGIEWANCDPPAPKLPTLFIIRPPNPNPTKTTDSRVARRELIFRSPHDVIDGIGALIMLNNLITHASKAFDQGESFILPVFDGSEVANLSPSYRIAANIPDELNAAQKKRLASIVAQKSEVASATDVEVLALPYKYGALVPGRHQRAALTLSKDQTTQLLNACRVVNVTPTHMFHAAAAMATRDVQKRSEEARTVRYISYILRNERSSCLEPYNTKKHPAALYHSVSGQSLIVDMTLAPAGSELDQHVREQEFRTIVHLIKGFYEGVRNDKEHAVLAPYLWGTGIVSLPGLTESLPVPIPKTHPSVSISSMGRIDKIISPQIGAFQTHDAWVTGEELGNGYGLFLGTFNDKLSLSVAYNDAWHTEVDVLNYLNHCIEIVFQGLRSMQ